MSSELKFEMLIAGVNLKIVLILLALSLAQPVLGHDIDLHRLPLGDGKISTAPKKGWIWACRIDPGAGGAYRNGPWIKSDGTFDYTAKARVPGKVKWPQKFSMSILNDNRHFSANDFPDHTTGTFPIPEDSEAYQYDRNPNALKSQSMEFDLPLTPEIRSTAVCAPGAVGILLSGAVLFNALDAPGRDAVAHETQDSCDGHPQESGVYHYHSLSNCVKDAQEDDGHSQLLGYAVDGFGIFGRHGEKGKELTSADLDECHGHTHEINWNGKRVKMYHYHATWDFPYTVGCLRGSYSMQTVGIISGGHQPTGEHGTHEGRRSPPDLAVASKKLRVSEQKLREALGPPPLELACCLRKTWRQFKGSTKGARSAVSYLSTCQ